MRWLLLLFGITLRLFVIFMLHWLVDIVINSVFFNKETFFVGILIIDFVCFFFFVISIEILKTYITIL